jgi:hypothetical protein
MLDQNESGLGAVLSPSQATQFLNCPAKWMFRYLLNLKEPGTAATALGTAFHQTIAYNYRQKTDTARDLPRAELLCSFREILGQQLEDAVLLDREQPLELLELGEIMLMKYLDEAAPLIQPAAVETKVKGVIGGVKVYGYVDLLDIEERPETFQGRLSRPPPPVHQLRNDDSGRDGALPARYGHQGQNRQPDPEEPDYHRCRPKIRRNRVATPTACCVPANP